MLTQLLLKFEIQILLGGGQGCNSEVFAIFPDLWNNNQVIICYSFTGLYCVTAASIILKENV
jgi:hypothetical protein